jgi:predicted nucleotidyltransferase
MMSDKLEQRLRTHCESSKIAGVLAAYLFGSRAEQRAHRQSDVDVGVLLDRRRYPTRRERFEAGVRLASELIHALRSNELDVVVLNDAPPELGRHIVTRGRRVFCSDPAADHDYVRDVQLRAADLAPFLRRMRRIKLGSLGQ